MRRILAHGAAAFVLLLITAAMGCIPTARFLPHDDPPEWTPGPTPTPTPDPRDPFELEPLFEISVDVEDEVWDAMLDDPLGFGRELQPAVVRMDGREMEVGVRFVGRQSLLEVLQRGSERVTLRIDFDAVVPGQTWRGLDRILLHNGLRDPSLMRQHLALQLYRDMGVTAQRSLFVRLELEGLGPMLYLMVEEVDGEFLRRVYGESEGALIEPDPGDLAWRGSNPASYPEYEVRRGDDGALGRLIDLIELLDAASDQDLAGELEARFDVDRLLRWAAVTSTLSQLDSYLGSADNYLLYERADGRWELIPDRPNLAFGGRRCEGPDAPDPLRHDPDAPWCPGADRPLLRRVLSLPSYAEAYHGFVAELLDGAFEPGAFAAAAGSEQDAVAAAIADDPALFVSVAEALSNLEEDVAGQFGLLRFNREREAWLRARLGL